MQRPNAREVALKILRRVEDGAYADKLLENILPKSDLVEKDRALTRELVLGVIKWQGRIDWVLDNFLDRGAKKLTPWIRNILRLGAYQILFLDKIPVWAAVDESVKLAKRYGHQGTMGLVDALLRNIVRGKDSISYPDVDADPVRYLSAYYSHPEWMVRRWLGRYGFEKTAKLCRGNNARPKVFIRTNSLKTTPERLIEDLNKEGILAQPNRVAPGFLELESARGLFQTRLFVDGQFQVQDPSAGLATILLGPQPGERILDLCSAPGGKATHIAELIKDHGVIIALDKHEGRLRMLRENTTRLGITAIRTRAGDALKYNSKPFDRVLVDVPCSGLGTLSRRADARWKAEGRIDQLTGLQLALLKKGAELLKPGGVLIYSTCTIEPEENEMIVEKFLRQSPGSKLERASNFVSSEVADDYIRTFPQKDGCDGSFAARMRRL